VTKASWGLRTRLFVLSVALVAVGLAGAQWYVSQALVRRLDAYARAQLTKDTRLAGEAVRAAGAWRDADPLLRALARHTDGRLTLIDPDGVVRADSAVAPRDLAALENHGQRPEVIAARRDGVGLAVRNSGTLHRPLVYAATRVDGPGGAWVVRVAVSPALAQGAAAEMRGLTGVGALVGILLAAGMSALAASLASRPLRRLTDTARAMVGDLTVRTRVRQGDEVGALAQALDALADNLAASLRARAMERDRLGAILEAMAEGVLVTDRDGNLALANRAVREMLPVPQDILGQRPIEALRNAELHEVFEAVRAHAEPITREITFDGLRPRRVMVRVTPVDDPPTGFAAVLTDVTELRRLETMRRDFVANVSHELRTPVAAVRAATETLLMGALAKPDMAAEFVAIIDRHAERLHRLVEDLLELSRLETREFKLAVSPLDLAEEVRRATELVAMAADKRGTAVTIALDDDLPPVLADRKALEQVLVNLLDNAIKYSGDGAAVTVRAVRRGDGVRLTVADSGPGIEAKHLPRLFERFYRVDASRSRQIGGTGLGLAIVKHLAEVMGAAVSVESEVGVGSRFHVDLRRPEA
jgi:two-component system phosphate regulon sensor histidine kinase PhoR